MNTYKSYLFRNKDPIIDKVRTLIADQGVSHTYIEVHSGVTKRTLHNWFHGETRRPCHATVAAVISVLGYEFGFLPRARAANVVSIHRKAAKGR
jgi:hypothetical protein